MTESRRGLVLTTALLLAGFLGFVVACQDGSGTPTQPTMDPLIRSGSGTTSDVSLGPLAESDDSDSDDSDSDDSDSDDSDSDDSGSEDSGSECPCWTEDELDLVGDGGTAFCGVLGPDVAQLSGPDAATGGFEGATASRGDKDFCDYLERTPAPGVTRFMIIPPADATVCFDSIVAECADRTP